jgi:membrane protein DedA with SNARE-associated domain
VEELVHEYRYLALLVGTFFEGETAIILASSLIHKGMFNVVPTVFFAFLGSFISDWLYFLIGRLNGKLFIDKRPKLQAKVQPITNFFKRNKIQILLTYRFLYGFRVIIPVIIGMSGIRPSQYLFFSIVSGLIWAAIVSCIGYLIGRIFEVTSESISENLWIILLCFGCFGIALGYVVQKLVNKKTSE